MFYWADLFRRITAHAFFITIFTFFVEGMFPHFLPYLHCVILLFSNDVVKVFILCRDEKGKRLHRNISFPGEFCIFSNCPLYIKREETLCAEPSQQGKPSYKWKYFANKGVSFCYTHTKSLSIIASLYIYCTNAQIEKKNKIDETNHNICTSCIVCYVSTPMNLQLHIHLRWDKHNQFTMK